MLIVIFVVCIATLSSAQIQRKDPSACDGAVEKEVVKGVYFNPHPYDCTQYVNCYKRRDGTVDAPVYRACDWGEFYDHTEKRCINAKYANCPSDKCKDPNVPHYKHSDPNKCGAYWRCINGTAQAACCASGQAFHPVKGCVPSPTCTDMCPELDRSPGCARRPISGSVTLYEQYIGEGEWKKVKCTGKTIYSPALCRCAHEGLLKAGHVCKPDVFIDFTKRVKDASGKEQAVDISGNNYQITSENVVFYKNAAYFNGKSKLTIEPLRPSPKDEGVLVIKLKYKERLAGGAGNSLQAMVTNGHCGRKESVMIGKMPGFTILGADCEQTSRTFSQPTVNKEWKEIIYFHDKQTLEARVCGAIKSEWAVGPLKDTKCGFQFGSAPEMSGYVGLLDDISIYRCTPLDAVMNLNY